MFHGLQQTELNKVIRNHHSRQHSLYSTRASSGDEKCFARAKVALVLQAVPIKQQHASPCKVLQEAKYCITYQNASQFLSLLAAQTVHH